MSRTNRVFGVLALSALGCGGQSQPPQTAPQSMEPTEQSTGAATTPGVGAATTEPRGPTPEAGAIPSSEAPPPATQGATPPMEPLTDAQIVLVAERANRGEVEQGKLAQSRATHPRVKKFAAMMVSDHGKADKESQKLVTKLSLQPAESALSNQLASDSAKQLSALQATDTSSFDRVYMSSQVDVHAKVLDALDTQLIPNAKNEELKAQLMKMRTAVEHHLKEAREIVQALATSVPPASGTQTGPTPGAPR